MFDWTVIAPPRTAPTAPLAPLAILGVIATRVTHTFRDRGAAFGGSVHGSVSVSGAGAPLRPPFGGRTG